MVVNTECSYNALHGLIGRANTDERLRIADEWLRENTTLTVEEYQHLRAEWHKQVKRYGTYHVVISCGTVKHVLASGLTHKQAFRLCKDANWRWNHNNGCMWDMEYDWEG